MTTVERPEGREATRYPLWAKNLRQWRSGGSPGPESAERPSASGDSSSGAGGSFSCTNTHNSGESSKNETETPWVSVNDEVTKHCPDARVVHGKCDGHGQQRYLVVPCKKRTCEYCGPKGRWKIAERIAYGVRAMPCRTCGHKLQECQAHGHRHGDGVGCDCKGMLLSACWIVLTFDTEEAEESVWKPKAVRMMGEYVDWLRDRLYRGKPEPVKTLLRRGRGGVLKLGDDGKPIPWKTVLRWPRAPLEYVATYELTERGRLHINLVLGPWLAIPQKELQEKWGARVWVQWVKDEEAIGRETAKSYSPESLSGYLSKLEQSVPEEWGRRVSFSNGWPKVPRMKRKGNISWRCEFEIEPVEMAQFEIEMNAGWWKEVLPGEWQGLLHPHDCDCFELVAKPQRGPPS